LQAQTFQGLGFVSGYDRSEAIGASADGSVVAGHAVSSANDNHQAFRWTAGGGMVGLGLLSGYTVSSITRGISGDGSVVVGEGVNSGGATQAFRWTTAGGMAGLGFLSGYTNRSYAFGTNSDGSVVVGWSEKTGGAQAYRWTAAGGMVGLGYLPGGTTSYGVGVSADGSVVVGTSYTTPTGGSKAFRWTAAGGMVALDYPTGYTASAEAIAVSADGSAVVGIAFNNSGGSEAFRWTAATGTVGLGLLSGAGNSTAASAVSGDGSVVLGWTSNSVAFRWTAAGGMQSIADYFAAAGVNTTGWTFGTANGVSSDGKTLVGAASDPSAKIEAWKAFIPPKQFQVSPMDAIAASGPVGGPFGPASFNYSLSTAFGSVNYAISGIPSWLNASFTSGTATTSPVTVTFSLQNVSSLAVGTYNAVISFTNTSNASGNTTRNATLSVTNRVPEEACGIIVVPSVSPDVGAAQSASLPQGKSCAASRYPLAQ
jgi:probable HAF family extracellular repeat protein